MLVAFPPRARNPWRGCFARPMHSVGVALSHSTGAAGALPAVAWEPGTDDVRLDIYGDAGDYLGSGLDGAQVLCMEMLKTRWGRYSNVAAW